MAHMPLLASASFSRPMMELHELIPMMVDASFVSRGPGRPSSPPVPQSTPSVTSQALLLSIAWRSPSLNSLSGRSGQFALRTSSRACASETSRPTTCSTLSGPTRETTALGGSRFQ
eukprot:scaffold224914_cov27-Tisochrysis_lutea.AAC.6